MTLKELMPLREICKAFVESTMDETHADQIAYPVIAGQLEAVLNHAATAFLNYLRSLGYTDPAAATALLKATGLEIRKKT